jgi:hypothetical protein
MINTPGQSGNPESPDYRNLFENLGQMINISQPITLKRK